MNDIIGRRIQPDNYLRPTTIMKAKCFIVDVVPPNKLDPVARAKEKAGL